MKAWKVAAAVSGAVALGIGFALGRQVTQNNVTRQTARMAELAAEAKRKAQTVDVIPAGKPS